MNVPKSLLLIFSLAAAPAFSQSMKVVVDSTGNVLGRYVRTNAESYTVGVQDIFDVPMRGNKVADYCAKKGQGVIWCKNVGRVNVYSMPSDKAEVVGHMVYEDGYVPETYPCLGKIRGWYKVKIDGRDGYVAARSVNWDAIDTF